jgi:hypothetical protein
MIIVGSLIVIVFVFVLLFPADAVLISRALLPYGLPCAGRGCGGADFSGLGGRAFRVWMSSSIPHLVVSAIFSPYLQKRGWWASSYLNELRGVVVVETATAIG